MTNHIKRVTIDLPDTATAEDARQIAESIFAKLGACWADKTSGPIYDETGRHAANATVEQIPLDLQLANTRHREAFTAALTGEVAALEWFSGQHRLSLQHYSPMYGDDDDESVEWCVHRESGSINDREWEIVGRGETALAAIQSARAALSTTDTIGGGEAEKPKVSVEAVWLARQDAAETAYRICAETRHVTLGDKCRDAILSANPPTTPPVSGEAVREALERHMQNADEPLDAMTDAVVQAIEGWKLNDEQAIDKAMRDGLRRIARSAALFVEGKRQ